jgi:hypothetical protein
MLFRQRGGDSAGTAECVMSGELPQGWVKARIGKVFRLTNERAFKPADWTNSGLRIVRIQIYWAIRGQRPLQNAPSFILSAETGSAMVTAQRSKELGGS